MPHDADRTNTEHPMYLVVVEGEILLRCGCGLSEPFHNFPTLSEVDYTAKCHLQEVGES